MLVNSVAGSTTVQVSPTGMIQLTCHFDHLGYPPANDLVYDWFEGKTAFNTGTGPEISIPATGVGTKRLSCQGRSATKLPEHAEYVIITMEGKYKYVNS